MRTVPATHWTEFGHEADWQLQRRMKRKTSTTLKQRPAKKSKGQLTKKEKIMIKPNPKEVKVFDLDTVTQVTSTGSIVSLIGSMSQGTASRNNYIGRIVTPIGLDIRYNFIGPNQYTGTAAALTDYTGVCRLLVFQWFEATTPTIASVFQTPASFISPVNIDSYQQINVLLDEILVVDCTTYSNAVGEQTYNVLAERRYIKGRKMGAIQMANAGGSFEDGGIYYALLGSSAATPHPAIEVYLRLSATDS